MTQRPGGGSLVVTSRLAAVSGQARGEHYAATKGALIAMMSALAVEFARQGVRENAILPGWTETAMTERALHWDLSRIHIVRCRRDTLCRPSMSPLY